MWIGVVRDPSSAWGPSRGARGIRYLIPTGLKRDRAAFTRHRKPKAWRSTRKPVLADGLLRFRLAKTGRGSVSTSDRWYYWRVPAPSRVPQRGRSTLALLDRRLAGYLPGSWSFPQRREGGIQQRNGQRLDADEVLATLDVEGVPVPEPVWPFYSEPVCSRWSTCGVTEPDGKRPRTSRLRRSSDPGCFRQVWTVHISKGLHRIFDRALSTPSRVYKSDANV